MLRNHCTDPPTAITSRSKRSGRIVEVNVLDDGDDGSPGRILGQVRERAEGPGRHTLA